MRCMPAIVALAMWARTRMNQTEVLPYAVRVGLLAFVGRVNAAHPWSHNDAFSRFVVRQARTVRARGGTVALDVGCGSGDLLSLLAEVFPTVIGIEPHPEIALHAMRRFSDSRIRVESRTFGVEQPDAYDVIVFVASLHHMPLRNTLQEARAVLRPGGRRENTRSPLAPASTQSGS